MITPEEPTVHLAYQYIRCSHESSRKSGMGLKEQDERIRRYYNLIVLDHPVLQLIDEALEDLAVSGWKHEFLTRPGGKALNSMLKPGDHIIFAELKTAFRSVRDALNTLKFWEDREIVVHFADLHLDISSANGRFMLHILAAVCEWEAMITSERNLATAARLRREGRKCSRHLPFGRKEVGTGKKKKLEWDVEVRAIMQWIVQQWDDLGTSFDKISDEIERRAAEAEGRKPLCRVHPKRGWNRRRCEHAYDAEKMYQAANV